MYSYFKTKTDVTQNLIDDFFLTLTVLSKDDLSIGRILKEIKYGGTR